MAVLEVRKFKDPILKKRCWKVKKIDNKVKKLIIDMVQTMEESQGIGLAAPQVGVLKKIIVIKTDLKNQRILALINPKIIKKSRAKEKLEEGCLSFPGIFLEIKRAKEIKVKAKNIRGEEIKIKAGGVLAKIIQHEADHLNGILFYNRLGFIKSIIFRLKHLRGFN
ncbi:MAG: peptide deformylase [Candidatus Nealsonbacteria bacterium RBG_13_37_56]|uniref:Peptide deformylase n=1 Tax=Candidatus Nealsonbacteria bacterium RBG_13_37_56 TaxID=1801661 RepID=A0A1G2DXT5_9BACT|nr:MAG: peptide deformylase [Candidatus Nealsonbacteria bacterium RBG_13_37_56]